MNDSRGKVREARGRYRQERIPNQVGPQDLGKEREA